MAVGIFGKLPAKRDYVQNGMPPDLMEVLDPWLQAAVAQSRNDLGRDWLEAYLASVSYTHLTLPTSFLV